MLNFISDFVIPVLTLVMARGTDWFSTNFSVISIALSRQLEFLLWSIVTGGYFYFALKRLFRHRRSVQSIKREAALFFTAAGMMIVFVLAPYLPARFPFLSAIHVISAFLCALLFFLCLFLLSFKPYLYAPDKYRPCLILLIAAAVFCICAFLLTGIINTAMEICFVLTCSLLVKKLLILEEAGVAK